MKGSLKNKTVLVCGASGKSGSSAVQLALELGARVVLSDINATVPVEDLVSKETYQKYKEYIIDKRPYQDASLLEGLIDDGVYIDHAIISPGLHPSIDILQALKKHSQDKQIVLWSENDFGFFFLKQCYQIQKKKIFTIGITGTDGKSTTTALITHLINTGLGLRGLACGNFGTPLCEVALEAFKNKIYYDVLVVESSSFQLENLNHFHPNIALILNLSEDHGDRYENLDEYFKAKIHILKKQTWKDLCLVEVSLKKEMQRLLFDKNFYKNILSLNLFSLGLKKYCTLRYIDTQFLFRTKDTLYFQKKPLLPYKDFPLPGKHNISNALFALSAIENLVQRKHIHIDSQKLRESLLTFKGLKHRLDFVCETIYEESTIKFYNDSKATTVQASKAALLAFPKMPVFLLCGGRMKERSDFSVLLENSEQKKYIFPFGASGGVIASQLGTKSYSDLKSAFEEACKSAEEYTKTKKAGLEKILIILLSPGCASFDAYLNYAKRGEHFCQLAQSYSNKKFEGSGA